MIRQYIYIATLLLASTFFVSCNEDINVSTPEVAAPIIGSFSPTSGIPGTIVEIRGQHLGLVDTVYLGSQRVNILKNRLTDELLTVQIVDGQQSGRFTVITGGVGQSTATSDFNVNNPVAPTVTSVPATGTMNETLIIKGRNLLGISRPFFRYKRSGGNDSIDVYTSFTFQGKDSIGVVVPVIATGSARFGYEYISGGSHINTAGRAIALSAPNITVTGNPGQATLTQRFELTGDNLNLVGSASIDGKAVELFKNESDKFRLILKTPYNTQITAGEKTLILTNVLGSEAARTQIEMVNLPAEAPYVSLLTYANFELNSMAFTKSISSSNANKQYLIYQLPMVNQVVTNVGEMQAPVPGEKFGHLNLTYNADSLRALGATVTGGIAFAHVACVTASTANLLKSIKEPVLHFWTNTNGVTPTFDLYFSLGAGYYFSNGYRAAVSDKTYAAELQTTSGVWKMVAIRLGDATYKTGSSTYGPILSSEVQDAFYKGNIEEIRIRVRTTKTDGTTEIVESNVSNFFISDRVRTDLGAVDITK